MTYPAFDISNDSLYQSIIFFPFLTYLQSCGTSKKTVTNYLSDIKSFFQWLVNSFTVIGQTETIDPKKLIASVASETIENFKHTLLLEHTPIASINRKLSSLRLFFRFAVMEHLIKTNPAENVANIPKIKSLFGISEENLAYLLVEFSSYYAFMNENTNTQHVISDIRDFLYWHNKFLQAQKTE
jgi:site-specific recombinase XerD